LHEPDPHAERRWQNELRDVSISGKKVPSKNKEERGKDDG